MTLGYDTKGEAPCKAVPRGPNIVLRLPALSSPCAGLWAGVPVSRDNGRRRQERWRAAFVPGRSDDTMGATVSPKLNVFLNLLLGFYAAVRKQQPTNRFFPFKTNSSWIYKREIFSKANEAMLLNNIQMFACPSFSFLFAFWPRRHTWHLQKQVLFRSQKLGLLAPTDRLTNIWGQGADKNVNQIYRQPHALALLRDSSLTRWGSPSTWDQQVWDTACWD